MHNFDFIFASSDHIRYENGIQVSGPHGGAPRQIRFAEIGGDIIVGIFSIDGAPMMVDKKMRVIEQSANKVVLRGYGVDRFGESFADYGVSIEYTNGKPSLCILHMHDRNVDIKYML